MNDNSLPHDRIIGGIFDGPPGFKRFAITDTHFCDTTHECPICRMEKGLNAAERYELWEQRRAAEAAAKEGGTT